MWVGEAALIGLVHRPEKVQFVEFPGNLFVGRCVEIGEFVEGTE